MSKKTCFGKFVELIPSILEKETMTTPDLYEPIRNVLPECITEEKCTHGNVAVKEINTNGNTQSGGHSMN